MVSSQPLYINSVIEVGVLHITKYIDYSIRVLTYLAVHCHELCTITDIANSFGISKNHLMKIVQALNTKGYLTAIRGKNGGLRLRGKPASINLGELVRDIEGDTTMVECFGTDNQCIITECCQLKHIFYEAQQNFYQTLEKYTLLDLVDEERKIELRKLLHIGVT